MTGVENQGPDFGDFPIQMAENSQKQPYFDGSYLGNRFDLEDKLAHFGKRICRATTYVEKKKIKNFLGDPPCNVRLSGGNSQNVFPMSWSVLVLNCYQFPFRL